MKKSIIILVTSLMLMTGCVAPVSYRAVYPIPITTHQKSTIVGYPRYYYPAYTTWRIGYDWGFGPRHVGHGHWHRRR